MLIFVNEVIHCFLFSINVKVAGNWGLNFRSANELCHPTVSEGSANLSKGPKAFFDLSLDDIMGKRPLIWSRMSATPDAIEPHRLDLGYLPTPVKAMRPYW